jgi:hypothetical protein
VDGDIDLSSRLAIQYFVKELVEALRDCDGKNHTLEIVSGNTLQELVDWITYE